MLKFTTYNPNGDILSESGELPVVIDGSIISVSYGEQWLANINNRSQLAAWRAYLGSDRINTPVTPAHYKEYTPGKQWIEAMQEIVEYRDNPDHFAAAIKLQVRKYLDRNGKDEAIQELEKGRWYLDYLISFLKQQPKPPAVYYAVILIGSQLDELEVLGYFNNYHNARVLFDAETTARFNDTGEPYELLLSDDGAWRAIANFNDEIAYHLVTGEKYA